jgi:hypothetical protein
MAVTGSLTDQVARVSKVSFTANVIAGKGIVGDRQSKFKLLLGSRSLTFQARKLGGDPSSLTSFHHISRQSRPLDISLLLCLRLF